MHNKGNISALLFPENSVFYHGADDFDVLSIGVHGGETVVEGHQFEGLLPNLINAAEPVLLEGKLLTAVLCHAHHIFRTALAQSFTEITSPVLSRVMS